MSTGNCTPIRVVAYCPTSTDRRGGIREKRVWAAGP
jgi:hypothetical protein